MRWRPPSTSGIRMAKLRVLCLACHDALCYPCPDARHPPFAGLRKPPRTDACRTLMRPITTLRNADNRTASESEKQTSPKNINCTPYRYLPVPSADLLSRHIAALDLRRRCAARISQIRVLTTHSSLLQQADAELCASAPIDRSRLLSSDFPETMVARPAQTEQKWNGHSASDKCHRDTDALEGTLNDHLARLAGWGRSGLSGAAELRPRLLRTSKVEPAFGSVAPFGWDRMQLIFAHGDS